MPTYTVVEGDTLWKIGVSHGLSLDTATEEMFAANPQLHGSEDLQIGQVINIPGNQGGGQDNLDQGAALNIQNQARHEASQRGRARNDLVWDNDLANAAAQWAN
ncbi:uncharacterized protein HMPREF1541_10914 [Cyphellophora europaea CBS 101466]|uniref:LysM domain-containing protein n=1 Tax=Cyphellophora europaea (strain CBS 101466) TaxID=1220924 RepID=W2S801_CYPE1|nr:uncharacterized protein HMPREF1541_10914 [Cyphellophora europaea CBS 101466]ETN44049.1 hypothetical protein HMPREF1541_10914 [Cyphellophora europaea CBS 101466]